MALQKIVIVIRGSYGWERDIKAAQQDTFVEAMANFLFSRFKEEKVVIHIRNAKCDNLWRR